MVLTAKERMQAAEEAVRQLRESLAGVGVTLPSLDVDGVSAAGTYGLPLIDLGRCNLTTALRLAVILHERARPA
ncbi:hypothetical protein [Streptomyces sp. NPDC097981]|uniref:hypothetical protein n=1 Tax=Streptomyces sp. NPDC097981 TaxID=3155428 RepID=UPI00331D46D7